ncbi:MAG TPA: hypothetical protein VFI91_07705 [Longimicrobiaceae bacterium]|nr:hypothetical protein [Longimicrobiaceae bacterium]
MADYERVTVLPAKEVFRLAEEILPERVNLERTRETRHNATYTGGEGTVTIDAHRHGMKTTVTVITNQLRTSKLDGAVRYLMNQYPYQHNDPGRE